MTNENITKPPPIERAWEKLDEAVGRLETALGARFDDQSGSGAEEADPEMAGELEEMRQSNATLRAANETVSERLNGVIGRLRAVLEE